MAKTGSNLCLRTEYWRQGWLAGESLLAPKVSQFGGSVAARFRHKSIFSCGYQRIITQIFGCGGDYSPAPIYSFVPQSLALFQDKKYLENQ